MDAVSVLIGGLLALSFCTLFPRPVQIPEAVVIRGGLMETAEEPASSASVSTCHFSLSRDLWVQTTEVTQAQWLRLMGNNPSRFVDCDDCPVESVNWYEALAYANALSKKDALPESYVLSGCRETPGTGLLCASASLVAPDLATTRGWRLPTEAEWRFVSRNQASQSWSLQEDITHATPYAWSATNSGDVTHPVAQKRANSWGLYDTRGNVSEWSWDSGVGLPACNSVDPVGPLRGATCLGGSYRSSELAGEAGEQRRRHPGNRDSTTGFRLVRLRTNAL